MKTITKSWHVRGVDGNSVAVSETPEGFEVVLSIQQNDEHGRIATVRLNRAQWEALARLHYEFQMVVEGPQEGD